MVELELVKLWLLYGDISEIGKRVKRVILITFTHTLTYFLETLTSQENQQIEEFINNASAFLKNIDEAPEIDELIIDEAQDISLAMHEMFFLNFSNISYGADDKQHLYQNATTEKILEEIYKPSLKQQLSLNFRNSYKILTFTKALFPDYGITDKMIKHSKKTYDSGTTPTLHISQNMENVLLDLLKTLSRDENIGILVPTTKLMEKYRAILDNENIEYSSYNYKDYGNIRYIGVSRIHLTTFHSSKGLEFDNVIIPEFQLFKPNGQYYVGLTRARIGLHLTLV